MKNRKYMNIDYYHFPVDNNLRNFTEVVLQAIEAELPNMRDSISDWYNYTYTMQEIATGGENMYGRRGNQVCLLKLESYV